ncbi:GDP-mannose 4,6-dehydratase [Patescibacteria group bacterium]|nr:GDP-mannose 4,6-dehydratase [Patescibacteria group bacterium]
MSRKILVTGNAGFIGSNLTKRLLKLGNKVVGIDNFNDYYDPKRKEENIAEFKLNPNFTQERVDILNKEKLELIFSQNKPEIIIHLAARAGVRPSLKNPKLYWQVNVVGTKNLLDLAKKYSVKQFIQASSSSVYGNQTKIPFSETDKLAKPVSPYAETKLKAEALCREYSFPITVLRFFTVYGPKGRPDMAPYLFTKRVLEGKTITRFGDGSTSRDYTYIEDIVEGIIKAIDHPLAYEIINLGNNQPVKLNDFISVVEKITKKKAKIMEQPRHPADVKQTFADIKKAKQLLNWQPKTDLETGMRRFIKWYISSTFKDRP